MILNTNNVTTPDQNSRLLAIGFTANYADEIFTTTPLIKTDEIFNQCQNYGFSLTRLIDLLPDYIIEGPYEFNLSINKSSIKYVNEDGVISVRIPKHNDIGFINNAYIEMVVETLEYLYKMDIWKIADTL